MLELAMSASRLTSMATSMSIPAVRASTSQIIIVQFIPIRVVVPIIGGDTDTLIALAVALTVSKARKQLLQVEVL